jgi:dUTP pyrophosphatase
MARKRIASAAKTSARRKSVVVRSTQAQITVKRLAATQSTLKSILPAKAMAQPARSAAKTVRVPVVRLPHGQDLQLPAYQTSGAAGLDLIAALPANAPLRLKRFARALVPTGLIVELPQHTEAQVRPRSGMALNTGVTVLNAPGTIDSDYRGEVKVLLINLGEAAVTIQRGDRIAQLVIQAVVKGTLFERTTARRTVRGTGGFGSTGGQTADVQSRAATKGKKKTKAAKKPRAQKNNPRK